MEDPKIIENDSGDQCYLFDIHTEEAKAILELGKKYKVAVARRQKEQKKEVEFKTAIREAVRKLEYPALPDGSIRLTMGETEVTVKPTEESVTIKFKEEK